MHHTVLLFITLFFYRVGQEKCQGEGFYRHLQKPCFNREQDVELKVLHGMAKARDFDLRSTETQVKLMVLAANLKRIAKLFS